jgi:hypothetical protein
MYLLLEHQDLQDVMISDEEMVEAKSSVPCSSSGNTNTHPTLLPPRPCTKRQRLGEPSRRSRNIRFVPDEDHLVHEIPTRQELYEEHGVEFDQLFYQPEDLRELKRQAYLEVRIVELTYSNDCSEDTFFREILQVDSKELQHLRIFLDHMPAVMNNGTLTCCLRGLEKRSSRYSHYSGGKHKKVRARGLATVLMGQERLQQERRSGSWRHWLLHPTKAAPPMPTAAVMTEEDVYSQMELVAQLYKEVTMPSLEAAQERAVYDELEAKAIHSASEVVAQ